ncbi:ERAD-associated E3 ubiquitin-protein ligase HRD1B [Nasonia vitripennis]|uniref:RING-type domain-containing protein n=1 Tax=Nasonia vitripennis TaxID=7425 RepID=A0A7M7GDF8_NASVI|nr:ERAD-associated E3 ubiquitin-protein ligase HRD1B [Nasonia vitripennis]
MEPTRSRDAEVQGSRVARRVLARMFGPLDRAENGLLKMRNFSAMAEQLLFFVLADKVLLQPRQRMTGLYSLMFYNVMAYCVSYAKELVSKEDWSPYVTLTETSQIKHLAMSATKIVLEWTKAVTFVVTLAFALLLFGLEQGLQNYKPSIIYTVVTSAYYMATEKVFIDMFASVLRFFEIEALESLENLYGPLILRVFTITLSTLFILLIVPVVVPWRLLFVAIYLNVYLRSKELVQTHSTALKKESEILARYRHATPEDIQNFDDVCAVCISPMKRARVTPCQHLFHASCLRECLKTSDCCPMCKRLLAFD